ncbi:MAG: D-alanine--D-alanine ligase family protein [Clostridia bacterium]
MKKNLLIIFGGPSSEYKISLLSASSVISNVDTNLFNIFTVGVTQNGTWLFTKSSPEDIKTDKWLENPTFNAYLMPNSDKKGILIKTNDNYEEILIDVAFPVMHGKYGEDGVIQGMLEGCGIPYISPGVASSANCMDKALTKIILNDANIPQAKSLTFFNTDDINDIVFIAEKTFSYPIFIKPSSTGSSIGISKATNNEKLKDGISKAFKYGKKIILEEFIKGREIEIAILGNDNPLASVCGEILADDGFYDFDAKYITNTTLQIPAKLSEDTYKKIKTYAIKAYRAVGGKCLSRIDFFVQENGKIILNEINTIPGFTSISMYSKLFEYSGIGYTELITKLAFFALED